MTRLVDSGAFDPSREPDLTFNQRWNSYLAIAIALGGVIFGFFYRANVINATFPFINREAGITARYPANWLLTENPGAVVFRAEDPTARPFKTAIQITLLPIGAGAQAADILNLLNMDRAARLPAYRSFVPEDSALGTSRATQMRYAYASVGTDPFLQVEPVTVRALDIVVLRPGQAIVITYEAAVDRFEEKRGYFDAFLRSLSF
jgi:hypothetical protein